MKNKRPHVDYKMFSLGGLGVGGMSKGMGQGPNYRPSAPQINQMGSSMPAFLHQNITVQATIQAMLPSTGLPGSIPPALSSSLPGNF